MFTAAEISYLASQTFGRLATANADGRPHVVPVRFHFDMEHGAIEIGGRDLPGRGQNRRYLSDIEENPRVAFVVDDFDEMPRGVCLHGEAKTQPEGGERLGPGFGPRWLRVMPTMVSAWGFDTPSYEPPNRRTR
ncbi:pyridoxamine 5'-phosphate oxidase family protein [Nonomuraea sp. NPDC003754]